VAYQLCPSIRLPYSTASLLIKCTRYRRKLGLSLSWPATQTICRRVTGLGHPPIFKPLDLLKYGGVDCLVGVFTRRKMSVTFALLDFTGHMVSAFRARQIRTLWFLVLLRVPRARLLVRQGSTSTRRVQPRRMWGVRRVMWGTFVPGVQRRQFLAFLGATRMRQCLGPVPRVKQGVMARLGRPQCAACARRVGRVLLGLPCAVNVQLGPTASRRERERALDAGLGCTLLCLG
jgi:hypothetical protein